MQRLSEIQAAIQSGGLDGWLLYDFRGMNPIAWQVAGVPVGTLLTRRWACYVPAHGEPAWLVHAIEVGGLSAIAPGACAYVSWQEWREGLRALMGGARRVAMEVSPGGAVPTVSRVDAGTVDLVRSLAVEVVTSADLVQIADAVWSPAQLEGHRRAAQALIGVTNAAFAHVREHLVAGLPLGEISVQDFILAEFRRRDIQTDHPPIVAVNAHAADPHYAPRRDADTPIRPGDLLLLDMWAREPQPDAVYADITWMGYCGSQPPPRIKGVFEVVRAARDAGVDFARERVRSGQAVAGCDVDDAVRDVVRAAGYGKHFIHRTGHSIGTSVHGNGVNLDNLETQDLRRLIPGVGFSVEPGIYLPEEGIGVRLEIDCYVADGDIEVTTLPLQQELVLLGAG